MNDLHTQVGTLVEQRYVSAHRHPGLPLTIYNYTARAQQLPISQWSEALQLCRGLILDDAGNIIGHPFRKFWNYEQVLDQIPASEPFTVWEKVDGSLGIACNYGGRLVFATRGSFISDQAVWARGWLETRFPRFLPDSETFLFEIVYPENRIVVDYGARTALVLLAVMNPNGTENIALFHESDFDKPHQFDGLTDFSTINSLPQLAGQEGLVIRWSSGFRAKAKLDEYKRLHRLITQCSTRTIWELLRSNKSPDELMDRVPPDFKNWASSQVSELTEKHQRLVNWAIHTKEQMAHYETRKDFADAAKRTEYPGLLFLLLDARDIADAAWKLIEPKWSCPFKNDEG